jgi:DNA-binding PadR family transcriptional regulator
LLTDLSRYIVDVSIGDVTKAKVVNMGGAYAMGAPWLRFAARCNPEWSNDLSDWLAKMTGHRSHHRAQQPFGQWGMFGGTPFGPPWWAGARTWRGPKARRGDVRAAILAVLAEQPMNGYQIIQEIASRSGGVWKPSPGSIYPTLQQLEDEGLVRVEVDGGRRAYTLSDEGRSYVNEHADEVTAPWQAMTESGGEDDDGLKPLIGQVAAAVWQIAATGTPEQQAKGRDALMEFRRKLYSILAEDDIAPDN